ncbi:hypothetical protein FKW77_010353 [Venturia effusa]|uniref:Uncharacterized protein n=1 Tax=Venturia effusa TaxID=50376 RepID=A0A517L4G1_9PEZI|nr:hypothetical protein FKW77_010353 [Venturia effusa]
MSGIATQVSYSWIEPVAHGVYGQRRRALPALVPDLPSPSFVTIPASQPMTSRDGARHGSTKARQGKLCQEFNQIQREKAVHVVHHFFGYGEANSTNERYSNAAFGNLDHIRHVKVVAEFSSSFRSIDAAGASPIDLLTAECNRFPRAKNVCVELRMSASSLPFYGSHAENTSATELVLILGIQSHLPSVFLPGPAPMENWLANIIKQFPHVRKVSLTWEGVRWRDDHVKSVEETLLKDSLTGMCEESTEINTVVRHLW